MWLVSRLLVCLKDLSFCSILQAHVVRSLSALHIKAEVMRWVYTLGSEKPVPAKQAAKAATSTSFFSSLFSTLSGSASPQRAATPTPPVLAPEIDQTAIYESGVALSIFTAEISVRLDQKTKTELHRSTKKNPPANMRLSLIYVSLLV